MLPADTRSLHRPGAAPVLSLFGIRISQKVERRAERAGPSMERAPSIHRNTHDTRPPQARQHPFGPASC